MHFSLVKEYKKNKLTRYKKIFNLKLLVKKMFIMRQLLFYNFSFQNKICLFSNFLNIGFGLTVKKNYINFLNNSGIFIDKLKKKKFNLGLSLGSYAALIFIKKNGFCFTLRAPSGCLLILKKLISFSLFERCNVTLKKNKFGFTRNLKKKIMVRGVAKNAADHKNGGKGRGGVHR